MAAKIAPSHYQRTLTGFVPVSAAAREFHAKTKPGQVVELKGRRPRNPRHHAKLFALLGVLVDNTDAFASTDDALLGLKAAMGRGEWKRLHPKAGREIFIPESIAFDAMGQDEFDGFYTQAVATVLRWWIPVEANELREAVEAFAA